MDGLNEERIFDKIENIEITDYLERCHAIFTLYSIQNKNCNKEMKRDIMKI